MGNRKVYTFSCPLFLGEKLITRQELADAGRSSLVIVDSASDGQTVVAMGMVESCSMNADQVIDFVRTRYPRRWCVFTRFDADCPEFRMLSWTRRTRRIRRCASPTIGGLPREPGRPRA